MENGIVRMLWGGVLHLIEIILQRGPVWMCIHPGYPVNY